MSETGAGAETITEVRSRPEREAGRRARKQDFVLLVDDMQPVLDWLGLEREGVVVRKRGDRTLLGWTVRVTLDETEAAKRFMARWSGDFLDVQFAVRKAEWGRQREAR